MHAKHKTSNHIKTILTKESNTENTTNNCNCRVKETYPVDKKCQTSGLIFQATVTQHDNNKDETYIGLTDNTFMTRYNEHTKRFKNENCRNVNNEHTKRFKNENYRNVIVLSNHIWMLKDKKKDIH